jgi:hypothetical protein
LELKKNENNLKILLEKKEEYERIYLKTNRDIKLLNTIVQLNHSIEEFNVTINKLKTMINS